MSDIHLWPDGTWCYTDELEDFTWMSDDYQIIREDTPEWELISNGEHHER